MGIGRGIASQMVAMGRTTGIIAARGSLERRNGQRGDTAGRAVVPPRRQRRRPPPPGAWPWWRWPCWRWSCSSSPRCNRRHHRRRPGGQSGDLPARPDPHERPLQLGHHRRRGEPAARTSARSRWSAYAPACQPKWSGNNGGATSSGVTGTTITLTYRDAAAALMQEIYAVEPKSVVGTNDPGRPDDAGLHQRLQQGLRALRPPRGAHARSTGRGASSTRTRAPGPPGPGRRRRRWPPPSTPSPTCPWPARRSPTPRTCRPEGGGLRPLPAGRPVVRRRTPPRHTPRGPTAPSRRSPSAPCSASS